MLVAGRGPEGFAAPSGPLTSFRKRIIQQPWLLMSVFNILRSRANPETHRRLLQRIYGANPHDAALFLRRPEILEHMVGYTLESMTVSARGFIGEVNCYAQPVSIDLDSIRAPVTVWHGDADPISDYETLRANLGELDYTARVFPDHGSLIMYEYWADVLEELSRAP